SEVAAYDPRAQREMKRWKLDRRALLGQDPGPPNDAFEGLAFREEAGRPGGGVLYLAHQRTPAMLIALAVDITGAPGTLGAGHVLGRWSFEGHGDITAVTYVPALQRLVLIADKEDQLLVVGSNGAVETAIPLPGQQQEGVAIDPVGNLWIADDQDKSLLKMDGALAAIQKWQRDPAAFQDPLGGAQPGGSK
ncbi:MAG TPA: SdiA-regulated domain-containing protein, partial [Vicinamibacteria bacterium]|nr:SdiA-regulated domain-containing protein [Vicinamibacteria bacterium]